MPSPTSLVSPKPAKVALVAGCICFALILGVVCLFRFLGGFDTVSNETAKWNDFGAYFGGVLGPLLSSLTFAAVVYTLVLQIQQIAASGREAELLKGELKTAIETQGATATALQQQLETSREEAAIATFFEMVRLHHEIVNGITNGNHRARDALQVYFEGSFRTIYERGTLTYGMTRLQYDTMKFDEFYYSSGVNLGHYFRNLYRIYKFVDDSKVIKDKSSLTGIIRAQLTNSELGLIFYNGIGAEGTKFKRLLEDYAVFENFNKSALLSPDSRNNYAPAAWGENANKP